MKTVTIRLCGWSPIYWELEVTAPRRSAQAIVRKFIPRVQRACGIEGNRASLEYERALTQVRAPLVERLVELRMALERAKARIYFLNGQKDDAFTRDIAALTGTGEK